MRALLIGQAPPLLGYEYVEKPPYEAVVLGSLTLSELLCFSVEEALQALAEGKTVVVYTPGLPPVPKNRALGRGVYRWDAEKMDYRKGGTADVCGRGTTCTGCRADPFGTGDFRRKREQMR